MTPPPTGIGAPILEGATADGQTALSDAAVLTPLDLLLQRGRLRATLAMLGPAFVAAVAYVDPGNFATNIQGGAKFGYALLWVVAAGQPDGDAGPVSVGQARGRDRSEPARAVPRAPPAVDERRPLGPGRGDGDGDRRRRVPGRSARPEPPVRSSAFHRGPDHRCDRIRDSRDPATRGAPVRARDHGAARARLRRVPLRDAEDRAFRP